MNVISLDYKSAQNTENIIENDCLKMVIVYLKIIINKFFVYAFTCV